MGDDTMTNDTMDGGTKETDWTKDIINKLVFGPLTGSATL
jgi:hypothetical protein